MAHASPIDPPEQRYPHRQRCRECRRYFGSIVVAGQWCSYECANLPAPSLNPADWPAYHQFHGRAKVSFNSREEVLARLDAHPDDPHAATYECSYCRTWHIGHERP